MRASIAPAAALAILALAAGGCKRDDSRAKLPATTVAPAGRAPKTPKTAETRAASTPEQMPNLARSGAGALTGTTKAARTTQLAPRVSGLVKKVLFKEGDLVEKGALLVVLDRSDFVIRLRMAQAARNTARAQLAAVQVEWRRLRGLLKAKAIPRGQFEKVDSAFKVARAGLAQAQVGILAARTGLAKTMVRAPFRAVVTRKLTEIGAFATVMPPSPLVVLQELDPIEVVVQVPEAQITVIKKGTALSLYFSALKRTVRAKVDRVVPSLDPRTRSFSAFVVLKNPRHSLRPGMFVTVKLASAKSPDEAGAKASNGAGR